MPESSTQRLGSSPLSQEEPASRRYQNQLDENLEAIRQLTSSWKKLSLVRGLTFLLCLLLLGFGIGWAWGFRSLWFALSGSVFLVFLVIAYYHEGQETRLQKIRIRARLARWDVARNERRWSSLPVTEYTLDTGYESLIKDLDLFGTCSLFQLIGGVQTPLGIETMQHWLVHGATVEEILQQQGATKELRDSSEFRERLRFLCHLMSEGAGGPASLLAWAEAPKSLDRKGAINLTARVLSACMAICLLTVLIGFVPLTLGGPAFIALFAMNFLLTVACAGRIHTLFNQIATHHREIDHYQDAFRLIADEEVNSELLKSLKAELVDRGHDVVAATGRLGLIAWMANLRRHGILFIAYLFLQFLFLWDFHVLRLLDAWKATYGSHVRSWLANLGRWEYTAALGQLSQDHPEWSFPTFRDGPRESATISCEQLGHPLLPNPDRIANDVQVGPAGSVLLVTGSNMSGKSTLLRSIGVNVVLAQAGSVVCARSMALSPVRVETSMRIQDSLADGVSFFMAELKRLKQVVDVAATYRFDPSRTVLFLLDEILQGTNSRERHIAVTKVVKQLIEHGAIGAVSTHDLDLAMEGDLANACRAVHFRESFVKRDGRKTMIFDYRMHDGVATTTNALELLRLVGLDDAAD